jgi:uncharacterized protein with HEPN domain
MNNKVKAWLYDILNSIIEIEGYFVGDNNSFEYYQSDAKTQTAVQRNLEVIGEAMNRIVKTDTTILITDSRQIIETRNKIIHHYDVVSDKVIWSIIEISLPILKAEVKVLLGE